MDTTLSDILLLVCVILLLFILSVLIIILYCIRKATVGLADKSKNSYSEEPNKRNSNLSHSIINAFAETPNKEVILKRSNSEPISFFKQTYTGAKCRIVPQKVGQVSNFDISLTTSSICSDKDRPNYSVRHGPLESSRRSSRKRKIVSPCYCGEYGNCRLYKNAPGRATMPTNRCCGVDNFHQELPSTSTEWNVLPGEDIMTSRPRPTNTSFSFQGSFLTEDRPASLGQVSSGVGSDPERDLLKDSAHEISNNVHKIEENGYTVTCIKIFPNGIDVVLISSHNSEDHPHPSAEEMTNILQDMCKITSPHTVRAVTKDIPDCDLNRRDPECHIRPEIMDCRDIDKKDIRL